MHRPAVSEYMRMDPHWEQIRLLLLCKENIFLYDVVDTAPCQRSLASVAKKRSIYITLAISGFLSQIILQDLCRCRKNWYISELSSLTFQMYNGPFFIKTDITKAKVSDFRCTGSRFID